MKSYINVMHDIKSDVTRKLLNFSYSTILVLALAFFGVKWIPIANFGGRIIEISNFIVILTIILSPLVFIQRFKVYTIYAALLILYSVLAFKFFYDGNSRGVNLVIMSFLYAISAFVVSNVKVDNDSQLFRVVVISYSAFIFVFFYSSFIAGFNPIVEILGFVTSGNRSYFLYVFLRSTFNSFVSSSEDEYVSSIVNIVSSMFTIYFFLSVYLYSRVVKRYQKLLLMSIIGFSFIMSMGLFSTSAFLSYVVFIASFLVLSKEKKSLTYIILLSASVVIFIASTGYLAEMIVYDQGSRDSRIAQYLFAIGEFGSNFFFGPGLLILDGYVVHNILLFSTSAGVFGLLPALGIYVLLFSKLRVVLKERRLGSLNDLELSSLIALISIFIVKVSFGGGGGLPESSSFLALALFFVLSRHSFSSKIAGN